tara:strand:+ start:2101 stop:2394 length:294 start_codon:yes stop_codon:yes gene_type:complete
MARSKTNLDYSKTVKAADAGHYRLSQLNSTSVVPKATGIDPTLLENKSANSGLKSLMSNKSKKTNETQESIGELTQLYYKLKSNNEELKSKIISGEA